jgi:hypothetical protein
MLRKTHRITFSFGLLLISLLFQTVVPASYAEVNSDYALKIALENQLEMKLKQVIMEITGTDRVVIFVNAELISKEGGGGKLLEKSKGRALVLPGVPEKTEFGSGQSELLIGAGSSKFTVNKITVSMWIDKSVPDSIVELIKDIAKNVISFSQNRGDQINVKKVDVVAKRFYWSSLFFPPNLFWLILSLSGAFLLGTVGMFFMDPLKKILPALQGLDGSPLRGTGASNTVERITTLEREEHGVGPAAVEQGAGAKDAVRPFSFLQERDIPSLAFLLRDKTPQDLANVVNYLDPTLSMRLLELFPRDKQVEVALLLGREEITNMEKVGSLEDMIKSKRSYIIGGENKLISLLDMTNEDVRDKIVQTLEARDAQTAMRLKKRIKSLETILRELPAQGIQVLARHTDTTLFAQVLKSFPEDIPQKVLAALSAGAAERLKEEIELSRPLSAVRLKREKQNLLVLVRRLIREGLVEVETNDGLTEVENN